MTNYQRNNQRSNWRTDDSTSYSSSYGGRSFRSNKLATRVIDAPTRENEPVPFEKDFYRESERMMNMSELEVSEFREANQMKILGRDVPKPILDFTDVVFGEGIERYFKKNDFRAPMPIQAQGWPMALAGRDMVGIAQTGSGKTISFALPALVHAAAQTPLRPGDGPIVLILAPTRELCMQIHEVVEEYDKFFRMRSLAVFGGVSAFPQRQALRRGVEVLVATPGRLIDLMEQGVVHLSRVTYLVLDEADRMLDMGFEPQLRNIIPKTNQDRQTLMWSATWPREVRELAYSFMRDYIQVTIGDDELTSNKKIHQIVKVCEERDKIENLVGFLKENDVKVIVFCNKKRTCDHLEYELSRQRYYAAAIHGDKSQQNRDRVISDFKSGKRNILIATDVAARGLDVKDVHAVINFDFPPNCDSYIHRIGRTARGNQKEGLAIAFFTREDRGNAAELVTILRNAGQSIPEDLAQIVPRGGGAFRSSSGYRFGNKGRGSYGGGGGRRW